MPLQKEILPLEFTVWEEAQDELSTLYPEYDWKVIWFAFSEEQYVGITLYHNHKGYTHIHAKQHVKDIGSSKLRDKSVAAILGIRLVEALGRER